MGMILHTSQNLSKLGRYTGADRFEIIAGDRNIEPNSCGRIFWTLMAFKDAHHSSKAITSVSTEQIESAIFFIRGERVMLDSALADLYFVETKSVNRAVKRNL